MYGITNNIKLIIAGLIAAALFASGWYINGRLWNHKYESLVVQYKEAALKAEREARDKELAMQASIDNERKLKDDEINSINTRLLSALSELHKRPVRVSSSNSSSDSKGATGAKLFREDAEFLTREAARADRAVAELKACYAAYDAVRDTINNQ